MKTHRAVRLASLLLWLYPPAFRRECGDDVIQFVRTAARDRGNRRLTLMVAADALPSLVREWRNSLTAPKHPTRLADHRPGEPMRNMLRDFSLAARVLVKSPGFTIASILTLALGIGANTAIFSLAHATLLRPLDVERADELVALSWSSSYPHYQAYTRRDDVFEGVLAVGGSSRLSVSVDGATALASTAFVSGNTFEVLGVTPALGRMLLPGDDVPNGPVVGVLGHDYWRSQFGQREDVLGRTLSVNGRPVTIVGVARKGFRGTTLFANPAVYVPLTSSAQLRTGLFSRAPVLTAPGFVWLTVIGRLKDGVSAEQAASAMDTLYQELQPPRPGERSERLVLEPITSRALGSGAASVRQFVLLLGGVVCLTLLIACANLANLLMARAAGRRREVGVRLALGASRPRVIRQMLAESLVLSTIGGLLGLAVGTLALRVLGAYELPGGLSIEGLGLEINREALLLTAGLAILTGLLFGAAPAWRASRTDVMVSLRDESRGASARSGLRSALVAAQVALSLVLLTGSGLFVRSLVQAMNVPLGFEPQGVALASVNLNLVRYDEARAKEFYDTALARVKALPQVKDAAWASVVPTLGGMMFDLQVEGYQPSAGEEMTFDVSQVGPGYFGVAGTRIIDGRGFVPADNDSAPKVAIINEYAAQKYFGGRAVGRKVKQRRQPAWVTIVGVAENTRVDRLDEKPRPFVYLPFDQQIDNVFSIDSAHLLARTDGDVEALVPLLGGQLRSVDSLAPIYDLETFEEAVRGLVMPQRMGVALLGFFSTLALILATIGIYGVASYVSTLRTREIGIRMALGATAGRVRSMMLTQGALPIAAGIITGLGVALYASRLVRAFLLNVSPFDPLAFTGATLLLSTVAVAASYVPAYRASRIEPVQALRDE